MTFNNKLLISYIVVIILLVVLIVLSFALFNSNGIKENSLYVVVKEKGTNSLLVNSIDGNDEISINKDLDVSEGDILLLTYKNDINDSTYEIIGNTSELSTSVSKSPLVITTSKNTTVNNSSKSVSSTKSTIKSTTKTVKISEDTLLSDIKEMSSEENKSQSTIKENFITLVDFIFYGGEIKGYTFKSLSDSAKAKVIYYTLELDNYIDSKYPDYKEKIGEKVKDIKTKLVAKYFEITTNLCSKYPDSCAQAKSDFNDLKTNLNFSWDFIKDAIIKYVAPTTDNIIESIKEAYEIFSGKA